MPTYDVATVEDRWLSRLVKAAVSPRPIAWVSSRSDDGADNLAPFSSYTHLGASPAVLQFNASLRSDGSLKDSARNAVDTGAFAVNVVTADHLERMDRTAEGLPPEESEFDLAGVNAAPCETIDAPRVADAVVTFECTLYDTLEVYDRLAVMGEVQFVHVDPAVLVDGEADARLFDTVGRLGGPHYTVSSPVEFERQH